MSLKIGIVGTGGVASKNYLPFLSKQEGVTLTYLSRTRSRAEDCAKQFGGTVVDTPEQLLAGEPDAVFVLTGERDRYEATLPLLELKPKRLFFEKPLVAMDGQAHVTEDDFHKAKELLQKAKKAGTETAMVFNYRFFEQTLRAREIVKERAFGWPIEITGLVHFACWSHCIDLIYHLAEPPVEIHALEGTIDHPSGMDTARDVSAVFRFHYGGVGTILGTSATSFDLPLFHMIVNYKDGRFHFRGLDGEMEFMDYEAKKPERFVSSETYDRWEQYNASFDKSIGAYLNSIRMDFAPPVPGEAGLAELQFEAAMRRSIAEKRPVKVLEEFPLDL
ncbi:Gfo/Idh/MocA family protein [Planctomycetota bacterium]